MEKGERRGNQTKATIRKEKSQKKAAEIEVEGDTRTTDGKKEKEVIHHSDDKRSKKSVAKKSAELDIEGDTRTSKGKKRKEVMHHSDDRRSKKSVAKKSAKLDIEGDTRTSKEKKKKKVMEEVEEKTEEHDDGFLLVRTSPKGFFEAIHSLTSVQREAVLEMGFGSLLQFRLDGIAWKLAYYIVDNLDTEKMEIKLANGFVKITKQSIHDILGFSDEGLDIFSLKCSSQISDQWKTQYGGQRVRVSHVVKEICRSTSADWFFKMNFICLFSNIMGIGYSNGFCNYGVMQRIDQNVDVRGINWCKFVWDSVKSCKHSWKRDEKNSYFVGPIAFLMVLYVDSTKCIDIEASRDRPVIANWTKNMLRLRENAEMKIGFGNVELQPDFERQDSQNVLRLEGESVKEKQGDKVDICSGQVEDNAEMFLMKMKSLMTNFLGEKERILDLFEEGLKKHVGVAEIHELKCTFDQLFVSPSIMAVLSNVSKGLPSTQSQMLFVDELIASDQQKQAGALVCGDSGQNEKENQGKKLSQSSIPDDIVSLNDIQFEGLEGQDGRSIVEGVNDENDKVDEIATHVDDQSKETVGMVLKDLERTMCATEAENLEEFPLGSWDEEMLQELDRKVADDLARRKCEKMPVPSFNLGLSGTVDDGTQGSAGEGEQKFSAEVESAVPAKNNEKKDGKGVERNQQPSQEKIVQPLKDKHLKRKGTDEIEVEAQVSKQMKKGKGEKDEPKKSLKLVIKKKPEKKAKEKNVEKEKLKLAGGLKLDFEEGFVNPKQRTNSAEKKICELIFSAYGEPAEIVFESNEGIIAMRCAFESLLPGVDIVGNVIDTWAFLLNKAEQATSGESIRRLFATTNIFVKQMFWKVQGNKDEQMREQKSKMLVRTSNDECYKRFHLLFADHLKPIGQEETLQNVDVLLFPVVYESHYFMVSFDLKKEELLIIDNSAANPGNLDKYWEIPGIMKYCVGKYLEEVNHPKSQMIATLQPRRLEMRWRTVSNAIDCGVFLMRHMETFNSNAEWDCGLPEEGKYQKTLLNRLRQLYLAKMLLSQWNAQRDYVIKSSEDFENLDDETRNCQFLRAQTDIPKRVKEMFGE